MKLKKLILPIILILVGVIATTGVALACSIAKKPTVAQQEFPFSITYEYNGKTTTIEDSYLCKFSSSDTAAGEQSRWWSGYLTSAGLEEERAFYQIDKVNNGTLCIEINILPGYIMGDPLYSDHYTEDAEFEYRPYCVFYDEQSVQITDEETLGSLGIKITDWDYPAPIENDFVFSHFSHLGGDIILPTLLCALLFLVLCIIFVRKDKDLESSPLDVVSLICNLVVGIIFLPVIAFVCSLADVNGGGTAWHYQVTYCIPALSAFLLSASICLRRKGFRKSGLIVQFVGPLLFIVFLFIA